MTSLPLYLPWCLNCPQRRFVQFNNRILTSSKLSSCTHTPFHWEFHREVHTSESRDIRGPTSHYVMAFYTGMGWSSTLTTTHSPIANGTKGIKNFIVLQLGDIWALRRHWRRPMHGSIGPVKDKTLKTGAKGVWCAAPGSHLYQNHVHHFNYSQLSNQCNTCCCPPMHKQVEKNNPFTLHDAHSWRGNFSQSQRAAASWEPWLLQAR